MSEGHGHTHDGSEGPGHTHGPPQMGGAPPPPPPIDPFYQAAIDEQFNRVPVTFSPEQNDVALCEAHKKEVCEDCGLDFHELNIFTKMIAASNPIAVPAPPNVVHPARSQAVQKAKEDGNAAYKAKNWGQAIQHYNMSANIALSRNPWEPAALMRDEMAIIICNRSATFAAAEDYISALVDADVVIQLKRPWSKGHFRKAKALLGLGRLEEARDAVMLGLQFEPDSTEMLAFKKEIEDGIEKQQEAARSPIISTFPTMP
ncbi:hypothetical protein FRB94_012755 [Tulasnella sp. JGI-2019a]|nr:hypothetical protein FRB94_012755 [Tulasnella sp. JGI-2019a]KAG9018468.1 hypothetical protein FRB93_000171 [Tulasnella sp. JGI-2019a]KAG9037459.1 hypothetical protein FRB95_005398 [Tulasnella sp. JGI-2019a]